MIPKTLHYFWFGEKEIGALSKRCILSWKNKMPDYNIIMWNEHNLPKDARLAWEYIKQKKYAFASDYARYYVLHRYGGIYLDTDVEAVKSFDDLLNGECFLGYEDEGRLNSAVVGAQKGSVFTKVCMDIMQDRHIKKNPYLIAPELANCALKIVDDCVKIYPKDYFYPYNPYSEREEVKQLLFSDITNDTYAIHHWEKKWKMSIFSKIKRLLASE